jgi:prepilin-type N-terminal cleavage/methylation domain-containing protein
MNWTARDPALRRVRRGFTLIELLTVIAIVAVLATLLASAVSGARTRSNQVVCRNNLRQVALAVEMYMDETGRRPRSLTRLAARPALLANPRATLCPGDPGLKQVTNGSNQTNRFWGNRVNASQEPFNGPVGQPDEGSWEAEIRETTETIHFSYLHALAWRRDAWLRLVQGRGNQVGIAACQLHGVRTHTQGRRPFTEFEGQTLRVQRDGAVVSRKIFRAAPPADQSFTTAAVGPAVAHSGDTLTVLASQEDYPWEFYIDVLPMGRQ